MVTFRLDVARLSPVVYPFFNFCCPGADLLVIVGLKYETTWIVINLGRRQDCWLRRCTHTDTQKDVTRAHRHVTQTHARHTHTPHTDVTHARTDVTHARTDVTHLRDTRKDVAHANDAHT